MMLPAILGLLLVFSFDSTDGVTPRYDYCNFYPFHTMCLYRERKKTDCLGYIFHGDKDHYLMSGRLNETEKKDIMAAHNLLRQRIARGYLYSETNPSLYLPKSNAMYELLWDDELEQIAQAHADRCRNMEFDVNRDVERFLVGQNVYATCYTRKTWDKFSVAEVIDVWAETRYHMTKERFYGYSPRLEYNNNMRLYTFAQMIWGVINYIGCARAVFNGDKLIVNVPGKRTEVWVIVYVCNYGPSGMEMRQPIYGVGPVASDCCGFTSHTYPDLCLPCREGYPSHPNRN